MAISYDFTDGNKLIYKFDLDLVCQQETPIIRVARGEPGDDCNGVLLEITLTKNGTPITLVQNKKPTLDLTMKFPETVNPLFPNETYTCTTRGTILWSQQNTPIRFELPVGSDYQLEGEEIGNGRHTAAVRLNTGPGVPLPDPLPPYTSIAWTQNFYVDLEGFPKKKHNVNTILNIVKVSATEYGDMRYYDPNTLFIIKDTDDISIRLGSTPLIAGADVDTTSKIEANGDCLERHDDRISVLEDVDRPEPDPDEGQYYITVYNNTREDISVTLTAGTGGSFSPESATVVSRAMNYGEKAMGVMFTAGTSSEVITLDYGGRYGTETVVYGVSDFLGMRDEDEGGNATNYISFHICPDNEVLNKADYEAR